MSAQFVATKWLYACLEIENSIRDAAKRVSENSTGTPARSSLTATVTSTIEPGDSLRSARSAASAWRAETSVERRR